MSTPTHFEDIIVEDTPKFEDVDKTTSMQELDLEVNQEEPLVSLYAIAPRRCNNTPIGCMVGR